MQVNDFGPWKGLTMFWENGCAVATTRYVFAGHSPKGGETLEMLLVYLWVVATSRPSYAGDGTRVYDQGEGAVRFLHAWRLEQGLEDEDSCPICP